MPGRISHLRPRRSLRLPAMSMVGTTMAVYVANRRVIVPLERANSCL